MDANIIFRNKNKNILAFTLVELLVVIAIIGLISSVVLVSLNSARAKARDARRQVELENLSKAIELYNADNGHYPNPCYQTCDWEAYDDQVAGHPSGLHSWDDLKGLLTPIYMKLLPVDPTSSTRSYSNCCGTNWYTYSYVVNKQGTRYVLCANLETNTGVNYPSFNCIDPSKWSGIYSPSGTNWGDYGFGTN